jgi:hypothetical protein
MSFHPLAKYTTLFTFLIALLILLAFVFTGDMHYAYIGMYYFFGAAAINLFIVFILVFIGDRGISGKGIGLLFLNIPTAIGFFAVAIYLTGIVRVTFINDSGVTIRNIRITGCEKEHIEVLENGDSETVWIDIEHDCQIEVSYTTSKGKRKTDVVMSYVTNGMGQKYEHHIGKSEYENLNY